MAFDSVVLNAGTNLLSPDELMALQGHPDFARFAKKRALELVESSDTVDPTTNTEIVDLGAYSVEEAQTIINSTVDNAALEVWLKSEQRKAVRSSLSTRIAQLKAGIV